jgi:hypothetical protein
VKCLLGEIVKKETIAVMSYIILMKDILRIIMDDDKFTKTIIEVYREKLLKLHLYSLYIDLTL